MGYALADVRFMLFVGERRGGFTDGTEIVYGVVAVVDGFLHGIQFAGFTGGKHFKKHHLVFEIVEDDKVFVQYVEHVRCVIGCLSTVLDGDILKIAYCVEGSVSVESAITAILAFHAEAAQKIIKGVFHTVSFCYGMLLTGTVGQTENGDTVVNADACHRTETDERTVVFAAMIIGTFHQGALWKEITYFQIRAHRSMQVAKYGAADCGIWILFHCLLK
ncbi:hypothetical protein HMPREF9446_03611 [Bacteroides fluxus YIT 12057]|uniref:Uncharacterized protein n=1 Tax=Bacteroides fluxus YIT 12057 TaxID=763034 RepID=F3PXW3_9BACE|nr:hypothetical protein HMPREF9446_03611 [Bacteroides fluxus YIT 12057]